jgi:hypothetical protein
MSKNNFLAGLLMACLLVLMSVAALAANPILSWVKRIGDTNERVSDITIDAKGNLYLTGWFEGTADFASDFGRSDIKTSAGGPDIYVSRINADGSYGWTKTIGGKDWDSGNDIGVDANGNVYIVGQFGMFNATVNFAADWSGADSKTSIDIDAFVTRINADGSYGWTRRIGGTSHDIGQGLAIDSIGNLYVVGNFRRTINFAEDFGGNDEKSAGPGYQSTFVTRINADGTYGWTKIFGANYYTGDPSVNGCRISVDSIGNIYLAGDFVGKINFAEDFGGNDMKSSGYWLDGFVTRISADGTYGWTKRIGGITTDRIYGLAVDTDGNIFVTGFFGLQPESSPQIGATVNFAEDFGGVDYKRRIGVWRYGDIFITRINANGTYGWTKRIGGIGPENANAISIDPKGNIFITGYLEDYPVNFGQDFGRKDTRAGRGRTDIFITKLNANGTYGWTKSIGGTSVDYGSALATDSAGNIYVAGGFCGTVNFAQEFGGNQRKTSLGVGDIFIMKIKN